MPSRRVVVTGLGVIAPNGIGRDVYWDALEQGRSGIKRITGFDPEGLTCRIAGEVTDFDPGTWIEPKKSRRMARYAQFAVAGVHMALEDAGVNVGTIPPDDGLLAFGVSTSAMDLIENQMRVFLKHGYKRIVPYGLVAATPQRVMGEILERLGWKSHPLYAPVVGEYRELLENLSRKNRRAFVRRFAANEDLRSALQERTAGIDDFMNWFQANHEDPAVPRAIRPRGNDAPPSSARNDAISRFLDSVEKRGF